MLPLSVACVLAWSTTRSIGSTGTVRGRAALMTVTSDAPPASTLEQEIAANRMIRSLKDSESLLALDVTEMNSINVATTLHRLAVFNKRQRAGRDAMLRDARFEALVDATMNEAAQLSPRSVSDVLWSYATLQHWPSKLLSPLLTTVSVHLTTSEVQQQQRAAAKAEQQSAEQGGAECEEAAEAAPRVEVFEPQHLSTMVWALARLQCKPTRLLERIELLALGSLRRFNMQNCANLLWGFAKLNYVPTRLLPALTTTMIAKDQMLSRAKPVEVSDLAFALGQLGFDRRATLPGFKAVDDDAEASASLLLAISERAAPDAALDDFSSRQLVMLIWAVGRLKLADRLPAGRMDEWVAAVRSYHLVTPLLAQDARSLERSLAGLGIDSSWISQSEILKAWAALAAGLPIGKNVRAYTDEELKRAFDSIDTDGSGDIDLEELRAAIRMINPEVDEDELQRMIALGDVDGDKEVSFYEFKKVITRPLEITF